MEEKTVRLRRKVYIASVFSKGRSKKDPAEHLTGVFIWRSFSLFTEDMQSFTFILNILLYEPQNFISAADKHTKEPK